MIPLKYDDIIINIRRMNLKEDDEEEKEFYKEFCKLIKLATKTCAQSNLHEEWLLQITSSSPIEQLIPIVEIYIAENFDIENYMALCYEKHREANLWSIAYNVINKLYEMNSDEKQVYRKLMVDKVMERL